VDNYVVVLVLQNKRVEYPLNDVVDLSSATSASRGLSFCLSAKPVESKDNNESTRSAQVISASFL